MAEIIPKEYHPSKAITKEEKGAFNHYIYRDGCTLTVRRRFEKALFPKWWQLRAQQEQGRKLSQNNPSYEWKAGKHTFVVRDPLEGRQHTRNRLFEEYEKVLAAGVRFESPIAILETPTKLPLRVVTRKERDFKALFNEGRFTVPWGVSGRVCRNVLFELGKMHGAGVTHAHLHLSNVLANRRGSVKIVDPKRLGLEPDSFAKEFAERSRYNAPIIDQFKAFTTKQELADIMRFAFPMYNFVPDSKWPWIAEAYRKGRELGRKRFEKWEEKNRTRLLRATD